MNLLQISPYFLFIVVCFQVYSCYSTLQYCAEMVHVTLAVEGTFEYRVGRHMDGCNTHILLTLYMKITSLDI